MLVEQMRDDVAWSLRAGAGLSVAAFVIGAYWLLYQEHREIAELLSDGVQSADFADPALAGSAVLLALGTGTTAIVGTLTWWAIVERLDGSSITRRGAIAGGITGALVVYLVTATIMTIPGGGSRIGPSNVGFRLLVGLLGLVVLGWASIPAGTVLGYLLALHRGEDVTPIWRVLAERVR